MLGFHISSAKSVDIVVRLTMGRTLAWKIFKKGVSLFKTSAGESITIEVVVNSPVSQWKIVQATEVLHKKSFEAMGAAVLE